MLTVARIQCLFELNSEKEAKNYTLLCVQIFSI